MAIMTIRLRHQEMCSTAAIPLDNRHCRGGGPGVRQRPSTGCCMAAKRTPSPSPASAVGGCAGPTLEHHSAGGQIQGSGTFCCWLLLAGPGACWCWCPCFSVVSTSLKGTSERHLHHPPGPVDPSSPGSTAYRAPVRDHPMGLLPVQTATVVRACWRWSELLFCSLAGLPAADSGLADSPLGRAPVVATILIPFQV